MRKKSYCEKNGNNPTYLTKNEVNPDKKIIITIHFLYNKPQKAVDEQEHIRINLSYKYLIKSDAKKRVNFVSLFYVILHPN